MYVIRYKTAATGWRYATRRHWYTDRARAVRAVGAERARGVIASLDEYYGQPLGVVLPLGW